LDIGISIIMMIRQLDWTFDKTVFVWGKNVGLFQHYNQSKITLVELEQLPKVK